VVGIGARPSRTLGRSARVRRRPEFERAYNTGVRLQGRFMLVFIVPNGGDHARLGVSATRKLGPAVERNRAKRRARELFRRQTLAAGVDIIIVPRREFLDAPFTRLESDYRALLARRDLPQPPRPPRGARGRGGSRPASRV
jgi:ribonuclease P protein component